MFEIKCTFCGAFIPEDDTICPQCGAVIEPGKQKGPAYKVFIQMTPTTPNYNAAQRVTVAAHGRVLWEGRTGQTAGILLWHASNILITYHMSLGTKRHVCMATVDPFLSLRYVIRPSCGTFENGIFLQAADENDGKEAF